MQSLHLFFCTTKWFQNCIWGLGWQMFCETLVGYTKVKQTSWIWICIYSPCFLKKWANDNRIPVWNKQLIDHKWHYKTDSLLKNTRSVELVRKLMSLELRPDLCFMYIDWINLVVKNVFIVTQNLFTRVYYCRYVYMICQIILKSYLWLCVHRFFYRYVYSYFHNLWLFNSWPCGVSGLQAWHSLCAKSHGFRWWGEIYFQTFDFLDLVGFMIYCLMWNSEVFFWIWEPQEEQPPASVPAEAEPAPAKARHVLVPCFFCWFNWFSGCATFHRNPCFNQEISCRRKLEKNCRPGHWYNFLCLGWVFCCGKASVLFGWGQLEKRFNSDWYRFLQGLLCTVETYAGKIGQSVRTFGNSEKHQKHLHDWGWRGRGWKDAKQPAAGLSQTSKSTDAIVYQSLFFCNSSSVVWCNRFTWVFVKTGWLGPSLGKMSQVVSLHQIQQLSSSSEKPWNLNPLRL